MDYTLPAHAFVLNSTRVGKITSYRSMRKLHTFLVKKLCPDLYHLFRVDKQ
jgi:hypothetical protein